MDSRGCCNGAEGKAMKGGESEKKRLRRNEDKTRRLIYASRQDGTLLLGVIFILQGRAITSQYFLDLFSGYAGFLSVRAVEKCLRLCLRAAQLTVYLGSAPINLTASMVKHHNMVNQVRD